MDRVGDGEVFVSHLLPIHICKTMRCAKVREHMDEFQEYTINGMFIFLYNPYFVVSSQLLSLQKHS